MSLLAELERLVEQCGAAVDLSERSAGTHEGRALESVVIGVTPDGEAIELALGPASIHLGFAGWLEPLSWADADEQGECEELALDFVAAALFGELRVIERRRGSAVLQRELEVCVDGTWRGYAKTGGLGLAGAWARALGRLERRVRSNHGRAKRPVSLRDAGPSGHPRAPWAGAGRPVEAEAAELEIDGELDLHNFAPKEVAPLVREYIEVCRARGVRDLRIVHGKGKGALRRTVHALLDGHEAVENYRLGGHREGSWGATIVRLRE
jgi:hypothetical protein